MVVHLSPHLFEYALLRLFMGRYNLLLNVCWYFFVLCELHCERATPLSDGAQISRIMEHFGLRDRGTDMLRAITERFHAHDTSAFGIDVAHHIAHVVFRHRDRDIHDR